MATSANSDVRRDAQVIKALFAAFCTSVPEDMRLEVLRNANLELKFLIAVQPRVSSFSHRRRHSLRHPALSMAVQRFYWAQRMRRPAVDPDPCEAAAARQRELASRPDAQTERLEAMLADYASRGIDPLLSSSGLEDGDGGGGGGGSPSSAPLGLVPGDGGYAGFASSLSGSLWHYRRISSAGSAVAGGGGAGGFAGNSPRGASGRLSESLMGVVRNSGQYVHLLEFPLTAGSGKGAGRGGRNSGSSRAGSAGRGGHKPGFAANSISSVSAGGFFFSKYNPRDDEDEGTAVGRERGGRHGRGTADAAITALATTSVAQGVGRGAVMSALGLTRDLHGILGVDDLGEEEEFVAFQQGEDLRWEQVSACYDQMLRAAHAPCKVAALAAAGNAMLNDAIRRFWDRVTVAPAAQERYRRMNGGDSTDDDADEGADGAGEETEEKDASVASFASEDPTEGAESEKAAKRLPPSVESRADSLTGDGNSTIGSSKRGGSGGKQRKAAASRDRSRTRGAQSRLRRKSRGSNSTNSGASPSSTGKTPTSSTSPLPLSSRRRGGEGRSSHGNSGTGGGTAMYMSPLQYVYLHLRMAAVLLPAGNDLEVEMLESVREDLLIDGAYSEDDPQLEHFFGKAPTLVLPAGVPEPRDPNPPQGKALPTAGGLRRVQRSVTLRSIARGNRWSDAASGGVAESMGPSSVAGAARSAVPYNRGGGAASVGMGGESSASAWDPARMPWLTYAQFWCGMMEFVDNWTCSAVNPVESAIFLLELYGDVFGHDWDNDDETYLEMLKRRHDASACAAAAGERARESLEVLASFMEMLEDLGDLSGSDSGVFMEKHFGNPEDETAVPSPTRRRSTQRFSIDLAAAAADEGGGGERSSSNESIDWTGRRQKDGWRYRRTLEGQSGTWKRSRRKTVLERSKIANERRRRARPVSGDGDGDGSGSEGGVSSNNAGLDSGSSQYSVYIIEEELNSQLEVTRRRRLHRHRKESGDMAATKERRRRRHKQQSKGSSDAFMYETCDLSSRGGPPFRRRVYHDEPSRRFRRLDNGARKDDYADGYDDDLSAMTSWSSYSRAGDDPTGIVEGLQPYQTLRTEMERDSRLRKRVRRTGPRSERRRFGRDPGHFYREDGEEGDMDDEEDAPLSSLTESLSGSEFSYSVGGDESLSVDHLADNKDEISADDRAYLLRKKSWLQRTLATKGIHIGDAAFSDKDEEAVLLQLLRMTERLAASAEAAGGRFEDGDTVGITDFDAALLAKLFAKPKSYTLEELQQSELMKALLAMGDDAGGQVPLTAAQMDGIVSALKAAVRNGSAGSGLRETASVRRRRDKLIAEALRLQQMLREDEEVQRRRRAEEEGASPRASGAGGAFDLTAVDTASGGEGPRPPTNASSDGGRRRPPYRLPGAKDRPHPDDMVDDAELITRRPVWTPAPPSPKGSHSRPATSSLQRPVTANGETKDGVDALRTLCRQERQEQERLFREFEAYCAEHAMRNSHYKLAFTEYTPEQLEAFFQHLCLGPRQQALLRGRAPLAPATSTVGGTLHQERRRPDGFALGGGAPVVPVVASSAAPAAAFAPAPVKVFTLTTADSLEGAMQESYQSYLDDRIYWTTAGHGSNGAWAQQRHMTNGYSGARRGGRPTEVKKTAGSCPLANSADTHGYSSGGRLPSDLKLPSLPGRGSIVAASRSFAAGAGAPGGSTKAAAAEGACRSGGMSSGLDTRTHGFSQSSVLPLMAATSAQSPQSLADGGRGEDGDTVAAARPDVPARREAAVTPAMLLARAAAAMGHSDADGAARNVADNGSLLGPDNHTATTATGARVAVAAAGGRVKLRRKMAAGAPQPKGGIGGAGGASSRATSLRMTVATSTPPAGDGSARPAPVERVDAPMTATTSAAEPAKKPPQTPTHAATKDRDESMSSASSRGLDDFDMDV